MKEQNDERKLIGQFRNLYRSRYQTKNTDLAARQRYLIHDLFLQEAMKLGIPFREADQLWYSRITEEIKEMSETDRNTVWVRVSEKLIDEHIHYGKEYTNGNGETKRPVLRSVRANFGTVDQPEWGSFSVRNNSIVDAADFKTGKPLKGKKAFPLIADQTYTVTFSRKVDGKYKSEKRKMTGQEIHDRIISISKLYYEQRTSAEKNDLNSREEAALKEYESSSEPADIEDPRKGMTR